MKARPAPPAATGHWVDLVAPGAHPLPAERCRFQDPATGDESNGYETTWDPDLGEQRALANGAPILLRVWGDGHPPVSLLVGDPAPGARILVDRDLWMRGLGLLFGLLAHDDGEIDLTRHTSREIADIASALASGRGQARFMIEERLDADTFIELFESLVGRAAVELAHQRTQPTEGPAPSQQ